MNNKKEHAASRQIPYSLIKDLMSKIYFCLGTPVNVCLFSWLIVAELKRKRIGQVESVTDVA